MSNIGFKILSKLCELIQNGSIEKYEYDNYFNKIISMIQENKEDIYYKKEFGDCEEFSDCEELVNIYDPDEYDSDEDERILKRYLKKYNKFCVICGKKVKIEELDNFVQRRQDCAYTDPMIGCCCCGGKRGTDMHRPECVQFACIGECCKKLKEYRNEYCDYYFGHSRYPKKSGLSENQLREIIYSTVKKI